MTYSIPVGIRSRRSSEELLAELAELFRLYQPYREIRNCKIDYLLGLSDSYTLPEIYLPYIPKI